MFKHITIHERLVWGYALVLGLAVAGATTGLIIGNTHQRRALATQQEAFEERTLLSDIKIGVSSFRVVKQLSPYLADQSQFDAASQQFVARIDALQRLLDTYESLHQGRYNEQTLRQNHLIGIDQGSMPFEGDEKSSLHALMLEAKETGEEFGVRTRQFIRAIDALDYDPLKADIAQQEIIALAQSEEFRRFVTVSDRLSPFIAQADRQAEMATMALQNAEQLRTYLILGSLVLSNAIAAIVAFYTSRAIATPLQTVTKVAQRVTQDHDFNVQIKVQRQDEIGILATTFNQLIQKVSQLLAELNQKNSDVSNALEQLRRQQSQLVQSEKMSSLGQLVAGIAHEINNPVNFIHGNVGHAEAYVEDLLSILALYQTHYPHANDVIQSALEECELDFIKEDLPKTLGSMHIGTRRIREIVLSLRNFARMDEAELKPAEIHDGLNNTLLLLQHRLKATPKRREVQVIRNYGDLPPLECYAGLLNQVFMNILANAIDAVEAQCRQLDAKGQNDYTPTLSIRTSLVRREQGDGLWAKIAIADNGTGIPLDIQPRIFDPFFTTKPIGKGTGMGMSICYQIIHDRHNGCLECQSTPGDGTEFVIQIPLHPLGTPASSLDGHGHEPHASLQPVGKS